MSEPIPMTDTGSEENQRMTRENERAVLYTQMDTWPYCTRCGSTTPLRQINFGLCLDCYEIGLDLIEKAWTK